MNSKENKEIVRRFYALMSELRFEEMFDLMAEDAVWTVAGNPQTFHHAGHSNKRKRREGFSHFVAAFKSLSMQLLSITAEDDRVAVEVRTRCVTNSGLVYENELLILLRLHAGLIVSIYEHLDQQTTLEFEKKFSESISNKH